MITIRELTIDNETSIKLMKCIKENEPEIWDILKLELKQALNLAVVVGQSEQLVCTCGSKLLKTTGGYYCGNIKCDKFLAN